MRAGRQVVFFVSAPGSPEASLGRVFFVRALSWSSSRFCRVESFRAFHSASSWYLIGVEGLGLKTLRAFVFEVLWVWGVSLRVGVQGCRVSGKLSVWRASQSSCLSVNFSGSLF